MENKFKNKMHMWGLNTDFPVMCAENNMIFIESDADAGSAERFIEKVRLNDYIIMPDRKTRMVHIGMVKSESTPSDDGRHRRDIEWLACLPRIYFSQGAMFEMGDPLEFYLIKNHIEEFKAAAKEGFEQKISEHGLDSERVEKAAMAIVNASKDYIIKKLYLAFSSDEITEMAQKLGGDLSEESEISAEDRLAELVMENYDQLDDRFKEVIQMKPVMVPVK